MEHAKREEGASGDAEPAAKAQAGKTEAAERRAEKQWVSVYTEYGYGEVDA